MEFLNYGLQTAKNMGTSFDSATFAMILQGGVLYLGALWIALIVWVTRDVINRSNSLVFQVIMISINIFIPIFGLIIYLIIRPTETLLQKYCQDLEYRAFIDSLDRCVCDFCQASIDKEYIYCPECSEQVKRKCTKCHKPYMIEAGICPYCGTKGTQKTQKKKAESRKK